MLGEIADGKVECLECHAVKAALAGHMRLHAMSLQEYRMKYTQDGTGDDVYVGWVVQDSPSYVRRQENMMTRRQEAVKAYDPDAEILANLSTSEAIEYKTRFSLLFKQADEDGALRTHIRDIVLAEISVSRYQDQIIKITNKLNNNKFEASDALRLDTLTKLVKQSQDQNLKTMDSLNLTRAKKQRTQASIESTPSRIISGFERFLSALTPEQVSRYRREEEESLARLHAKAQAIRDLAPLEAT